VLPSARTIENQFKKLNFSQFTPNTIKIRARAGAKPVDAATVQEKRRHLSHLNLERANPLPGSIKDMIEGHKNIDYLEHDPELLELQPLIFEKRKRKSIESIDDKNTSLLGSGIQSTLTRDLKISHKPLDILKTSTIKE